MANNFKYKVWCHNKNEWETDFVFLTPQGVLYQNKSAINIPLKDDTHTICRFTGLYDKNGKEIYEGDIIDINQTVNGQNLFIITFDSKTKGIMPKYLWGRKYEYSIVELLDIDIVDCQEKTIEVVGNIFENKELIEDGKSN